MTTMTMPISAQRRYVRNTVANVLRILINAVVAVILPAYLTHKLPVSTYGAWVLVLQLGAYVSYLDIGVQTAVAKYIAEYRAKNEPENCDRAATAGFRLLVTAAVFGLILMPIVALCMPHFFHQIPASLRREAQIGVILIGGSLAVNLACSAFPAIFQGLQEYRIPNAIGILNKVLYGATIVVTVLLHGSMVQMGIVAAVINIGTAVLQIVTWKKWASFIHINVSLKHTGMTKRVFEYCGVLSIWSASMLFISGLDLTIVGHYAFAQTAFYAVAVAPASMQIMLLSAGLGPMMPAASALSVQRSARMVGTMLVKVTRYAAIYLVLTGLPLIVCAPWLLTLWVGPVYAERSVYLLRILAAANIIRYFLSPYATFVIAIGKQRVATISAVSEGVVNLTVSVLLARHHGAVGVAYGTLIGAVTGVLVHIAVSMHFTYDDIAVSRKLFFYGGLLRPFLISLPSGVWLLWQAIHPAALSVFPFSLWMAATILAAWFISLRPSERDTLVHFAGRHFHRQAGSV
ncbi:polysaccharide biosynthesis protein [Silvibacterium acidisoli]|uniref:polysaccharide biosynthesis protein n=1 Tax=Acidobacteriaceae bacterium ZG23-2 TaxID=2883246 RepID=UPI00406C3614